MKNKLYYGNLKECIYTGFVGNIFGAEHDTIIEKGIYLIKLNENEYIRLEELLSNKKKKEILKTTASKRGEIFVDDLELVNDLVESKKLNKRI